MCRPRYTKRRTLSPITFTNPVNNEQERAILLEDRALLQAAGINKSKAHGKYRLTSPSLEECFKGVMGRSLAMWISGPTAKTPEELATRAALYERYLTHKVMTREQYLTRD